LGWVIDTNHSVTAGLVPAIHACPRAENVDARDKPGHDDVCAFFKGNCLSP